MARYEKLIVNRLALETPLDKLVAVTVLAAAATGASAADTELENGTITGIVPTGNQDQFVDDVTIAAATGVVTVTLAANATANNTFNVTVRRAQASFL